MNTKHPRRFPPPFGEPAETRNTTGSIAGHRLPADGKAVLRHGRFVGTLLSLFILLFDLVPAAAFPARIRDGGVPLVVCTAEGPVAVDPRSDGDHSAAPSAGTSVCVFCLPLLHGGLPPQGACGLALPPTRVVSVIRADRTPPRPQAKLRGSVDARAPPLA